MLIFTEGEILGSIPVRRSIVKIFSVVIVLIFIEGGTRIEFRSFSTSELYRVDHPR